MIESSGLPSILPANFLFCVFVVDAIRSPGLVKNHTNLLVKVKGRDSSLSVKKKALEKKKKKKAGNDRDTTTNPPKPKWSLNK